MGMENQVKFEEFIAENLPAAVPISWEEFVAAAESAGVELVDRYGWTDLACAHNHTHTIDENSMPWGNEFSIRYVLDRRFTGIDNKNRKIIFEPVLLKFLVDPSRDTPEMEMRSRLLKLAPIVEIDMPEEVVYLYAPDWIQPVKISENDDPVDPDSTFMFVSEARIALNAYVSEAEERIAKASSGGTAQ